MVMEKRKPLLASAQAIAVLREAFRAVPGLLRGKRAPRALLSAFNAT